MACEKLHSAARSVHLCFELPDNVPVVFNNVCVQQSQRGTYFCVIAFSGGYCGIQELGDGQKKAIFSVWDCETEVDPELPLQARVVYTDKNVDSCRFGGEGTGAKTMMTYNWEVDEPICFKLTAELDTTKKWTSYACYIRKQVSTDWLHMATLQTMNKGKLISHVYSFIEDFRRDGTSFQEHRSACFGNCITEGPNGRVCCKKAKFTADNSTPVNINSGRKNEMFFLETGGMIGNNDIKLNSDIVLE